MRQHAYATLTAALFAAATAFGAEMGHAPLAPGTINLPQLAQPQIPGAAFAAPQTPGLPAGAPELAVPEAAGQGPTAEGSLERAAAPFGAQAASPAQQFVAGQQAFDGFGGGSYDEPDNQHSWYDQHTGQYETQTTKIKKAYDLALSHPLAAAIKGALQYNTLYRVDNDARFDDYTVRTTGDDPEQFSPTGPEGLQALVIFKHAALRQLAPEYLAAKLASMWARHLYRDTIPPSAEKTYIEGSVWVRVFMGLTGSNSSWWNGPKDRVVSVPGHWDNDGKWITQNFETFLHQYFWRQGFSFQNVRQGPYFKDKIMGAQGQPDIDADSRGRRTLFQRAQNGEISQPAAADAQQRFNGFVSNEQR